LVNLIGIVFEANQTYPLKVPKPIALNG